MANISYYFVGTVINGKEELDKFDRDGIWKLGWYNNEDAKQYKNMLEKYNKIKKGDILFAKSTYTRKNVKFDNPNNMYVSTMSIKAKGIVLENKNDGHELIVDWTVYNEKKEWYFYTGRETIWEVDNEDNVYAQKLIDFALDNEIQDYSFFINEPSWNKYKQVDDSEDNNIEDIKENISKQIFPLNKIIYGPPGTGKTFKINEIKEELVGSQKVNNEIIKYDNFTWKEIILYTFKNNNYAPLKISNLVSDPIIIKYLESKNVKQPGHAISTTIYEHATSDSTTAYIRKDTNLFQKNEESKWIVTDEGKDLAEEIKLTNTDSIKDSDYYFNMVTFHQSYGYEDFIEGIRAEVEDGIVQYKIEDGVFKEFCRKAKKEPNKNFLFAIDEINRGNISKIFGELITLIENTKRLGGEEELEVVLPYSKELFGVPSNVYILGTMNTADRSISLMDTALRRRFDFEELMPDSNIIKKHIGDTFDFDLSKILDVINARIECLYDREHSLGHAFFLNISNLEDLKSAFDNKIIPLLQEYFYDDYEKIKAILNDTEDIYVKKNHNNINEIFGKMFVNNLSDIEENRYALNTSISIEEFEAFINNIIIDDIERTY